MSNDPNPNPEPASGDPAPEPDQAFTQADVDRIVKERVQREKAKYADYDDLKTKAGNATTLEERVAQIERQAQESESRALRAEVANAKGLTPSQAKRLVGATRDELEADADELLKDIGAQKKQNNRVPNEGKTPTKAGDDGMREFTRGLFARANVD
jgi:erythromycin esterase-like protein